jgi:hypothetical protein
VQGCTLRVSALDSTGHIIPTKANPDGTITTGVYTTDAFLRVQFTPEYEEGQEITERNANGSFCVRYKEPDRLKWTNLELAICDPDPELTHLLAGGSLIYNPDDGTVIGWAAPEETAVGGAYEPPHVAMEVWSYAVTGDRKDTVYPYYWWVFPDAQLTPTEDRIIENGLLANTFAGKSVGNPSFGVGPDPSNPWPAPNQTSSSFAYARCTGAYIPATRGWWTNELTLSSGRTTVLQLNGYVPISQPIKGSVKVKDSAGVTHASPNTLIMVYKGGLLMGDLEIITNSLGEYSISGVGPGSYQLKVYEQDPDLTTMLTLYSADKETSGESPVFTVPYYGDKPADPPVEESKIFHFIYTQPSEIRVYVTMIDPNINAGIRDITVKLLDENKLLVRTANTTTYTDAAGVSTIYAKFDKLKNMAYYAEVDETDPTLIAAALEKGVSLDTAGLSDKIDMSDPLKAGTIQTSTINYVKPLTIVGTVGVKNEATGSITWVENASIELHRKVEKEVKINNVTEKVITDELYRTATTDKEGKFTIKDLGVNGAYEIYPNTKGGLENPLVLAIKASGASTAGTQSAAFTILNGVIAPTDVFPFLYGTASSFSGRITVNNTTPLQNVPVQLYKTDVVAKSASAVSGQMVYSDMDGNYKFSDIAARGTYHAEVIENDAFLLVIRVKGGAALTAGPSSDAVLDGSTADTTAHDITYKESATLTATLVFANLGSHTIDTTKLTTKTLEYAPINATSPDTEPTQYSLYDKIDTPSFVWDIQPLGVVSSTTPSGTLTLRGLKGSDNWYRVKLGGLSEPVPGGTPVTITATSEHGVKITNAEVTAMGNVNFAPPTIGTLEPSTAAAGGPDVIMRVKGTGFTTSSKIFFNHGEERTVFISDKEVTTIVKPSTATGAWKVPVEVDTGGVKSNAVDFQFTAPTPAITTLTPNQVVAGSSDLTLTVAGTEFIAHSKILWNGNEQNTVYVSSTQLTAVIPSGFLATAGSADVEVRTPGTAPLTSNKLSFTIATAGTAQEAETASRRRKT